MEGVIVSIFVLTVCLLLQGPLLLGASPSKSVLHAHLRRSMSVRQVTDPTACNDQTLCDSTPDVCTADKDLAMALCPMKCGGCICEDTIGSQGNCANLAPDICTGDFGVSLCPKTCNLCGQKQDTCMDHVTGIACADLPDPCGDALGKVACPKYCGFCTEDTTVANTQPTTASTTMKTTPPTTKMTTAITPATTGKPPSTHMCDNNPCLNGGVCKLASTSYGYTCVCPNPYQGSICQIKDVPTTVATTIATTVPTTIGTTAPPATCNKLTDKGRLPCQPGEIVFLIEHSYKDDSGDIDHEGDFIKELVDAWYISSAKIRIGVVIYHDTVSEVIHITDYPNDPSGLKDAISRLTRGLRPSGSADLAKALDFVRENSFNNSRPGVVKVAMPIVHQMSSRTKGNIVAAAQKLKDSCVSIVGTAVGDDSLDYDVLHDAVSQPYRSFYSYFRSFYTLESTAQWVNNNSPGCRSSGDR